MTAESRWVAKSTMINLELADGRARQAEAPVHASTHFSRISEGPAVRIRGDFLARARACTRARSRECAAPSASASAGCGFRYRI